MKIYNSFNDLYNTQSANVLNLSVFNRQLKDIEKTGVMNIDQAYQSFRMLVDSIKSSLNTANIQELEEFDSAITGLYDAYNNGTGLNDIPNYRGPESFSSQNDNYLDAYADTIVRFANKYLPYYDSNSTSEVDSFGGNLVSGFDKLIQGRFRKPPLRYRSEVLR